MTANPQYNGNFPVRRNNLKFRETVFISGIGQQHGFLNITFQMEHAVIAADIRQLNLWFIAEYIVSQMVLTPGDAPMIDQQPFSLRSSKRMIFLSASR